MQNIEVPLSSSAKAEDSSGPRPAVWRRFLLPSLTDLIFVAVLAGLCGPLAQRLLGDAGIGWHIRTGEIILRTHSVPHTDLFSATMVGKPWYAWEWLYDTGVAVFHHLGGLNGVVLANAGVIALTFALVLHMMMARGAGLGVATGLLLLLLLASSIHLLARPHVVSWLLTVAWFGVLEKFAREPRVRTPRWLPVLMLVWVNVHGGFVVGLALVGIYFASACVELIRSGPEHEPAWQRAKALAIAGAASVAVTLVNPYGYALHIHIHQYLTDRFLMSHIDEFAPPKFSGLAFCCFLAIAVLGAAAIIPAWKRVRTSDILVVVLAVYAGCRSARNLPWAAALLALVAAPYIAEALKAWVGKLGGATLARRVASRWAGLSMRMSAVDHDLRGHAWAALAVIAVAWTTLHAGYAGSVKLMAAQFDAKRFPAGAVDLLMRSDVREPIFTPDWWGGYVIYRMYPQARVVVDDRHDLYGAQFFRNYLKIWHDEPGWEQALEEMDPDWVLVPVKAAITPGLIEAQNWKAIYRDGTSVLFERRGHVPAVRSTGVDVKAE